MRDETYKLSDWNKGRLSGYSPCCCVWYHVRLFVMKKFPSKEKFVRDISGKYKYQHVVCPLHKLKNKFITPNIQYSYCKDCDWMQFNRPRCNFCNKVPSEPYLRPVYKVTYPPGSAVGKMVLHGYKDSRSDNERKSKQ